MTTISSYRWDLDDPAGYKNEVGYYRTEKEWNFIKLFLPERQLNILDIGDQYGSGRIMLPLVDMGHRVTVIEKKASAFRLLKRQRSKLHDERKRTQLKLIHGDFLSHEFTEKFDIILSINALERFVWKHSMSKVNSLLHTKGLMILALINGSSWRWCLRNIRRIAKGQKNPYTVMSPSQYRTLLESSGFRILEIRGFMWIPLNHTSNSSLVRVFGKLEELTFLSNWVGQSPRLLISVEKN